MKRTESDFNQSGLHEDIDDLDVQFMYTLGASAWFDRNRGREDCATILALERMKNATSEADLEDLILRGLERCVELSREDSQRREVSYFMESLTMKAGSSLPTELLGSSLKLLLTNDSSSDVIASLSDRSRKNLTLKILCLIAKLGDREKLLALCKSVGLDPVMCERFETRVLGGAK